MGIFTGTGLVGVWIFFALSGYLLTIPFVNKPDIIFNWNKMKRYFMGRLARIIPMYYACIFIYYMVPAKVHLLNAHLLFLRGDGHFWTIPQEMLFYMILPVVLVLMCLAQKFHFVIALLILATITVLQLFDDPWLSIQIVTDSSSKPLFIACFLAGVVISYVVNYRKFSIFLTTLPTVLIKIIGLLALATLLAVILLGSITLMEKVFDIKTFQAFQYRGLFSLAAAFLVFSAVIARQTIYGKILRWRFLRSFGILGFSVYLLHPLLLELIRKYVQFYFEYSITGFKLFIATLAITWIVSTITFNLIEYPFIRKNRKQKLSNDNTAALLQENISR